IAKVELLFYEVGLRWERDVFVWGCSGRWKELMNSDGGKMGVFVLV
ncbi:hypothetical protein Tco_0447558, partial [Tanacetum coccineum]